MEIVDSGEAENVRHDLPTVGLAGTWPFMSGPIPWEVAHPWSLVASPRPLTKSIPDSLMWFEQ